MSLNRFADRSDECKCQYKRENKDMKPAEMWEGEYGEGTRCPPLGGSQGSMTKAQFKRFICAQASPTTPCLTAQMLPHCIFSTRLLNTHNANDKLPFSQLKAFAYDFFIKWVLNTRSVCQTRSFSAHCMPNTSLKVLLLPTLALEQDVPLT